MAEEETNPVNELVELVKGYALQETVEPLKPVGTFIMWGAAGALLMGTGIFLLCLALLRFLQTLDVFDGNFTVFPYLIISVVVFALCGLFGTQITKGI